MYINSTILPLIAECQRAYEEYEDWKTDHPLVYLSLCGYSGWANEPFLDKCQEPIVHGTPNQWRECCELHTRLANAVQMLLQVQHDIYAESVDVRMKYYAIKGVAMDAIDAGPDKFPREALAYGESNFTWKEANAVHDETLALAKRCREEGVLSF